MSLLHGCKTYRLATLGWLLAVLIGCSSGAPEQDSSSGDGFEAVGTLNLTQELILGEERGIIFGRITDLDVDSEGTIYVADYEYHTIRRFTAGGDSLNSIGRKGEGPGEFARLFQIEVGPNDSLYAFDQGPNRISLFDPKGSYVRSFVVSSNGKGYPIRMMKPDTSGFLVQYGIGFRADEEEKERSRWISWLDRKGDMHHDSLLVVPSTERLVHRDSDMMLVLAKPFGRGPVLALGPQNTIYYGRTDSLAFEGYALSGEKLGRFQLRYEPIPVTEEDIEAKVKEFGESPFAEEAQPLIREADLAATRPAFDHLVVDDRGRLWTSVTTAADSTRWMVIDSRKKTKAWAPLPQNVTIHAVRDGKAYGVQRDAMGVQEVVAYDVAEAADK